MACQNCGKTSDTCGTIVSSACVNWTGDISDFPCITVPNGFCIDSLDDLLTLFGNEICSLNSQIDLSKLDPNCLTLTTPYTINSVVQQLVNSFCPIITQVNTITTELTNILTIPFSPSLLTWGPCFSFGPCSDVSEMDNLLNVLNQLIDKICSVSTIANAALVAATANNIAPNQYFAKITLSAAQILSLNSTPITLIAAQGVGTVIVPTNISSNLIFNSAAYTTHTTLDYNLGTTLVTTDAVSLLATNEAITLNPIPTIQVVGATPNIINAPLTVTVAGGNPTVGDSPISIYIYYQILTL